MIKRVKKGNEKHTGVIVSVVVVALTLAGGLITGLSHACSALSDVWKEQCSVTDRDIDVVITSSGHMVHPETVSWHFGLTNGANLATIRFAELRKDMLERIPNVRDIHIERRMPNRVTIEVLEREPIARIFSRKGSTSSDRVADADGIVFRYNGGETISQLPIVREHSDQPTAPGKKLAGFAGAAMRLVETASLPELAELKVLEVDTSHDDYLYVTLGNMDHAKIAWDHMKDDSAISRNSLRKQLKHLSDAINANLTPQSTVWLATDWGPHSRITASGAINRAGN